MLSQAKEWEKDTYFLCPGVHRFVTLSMAVVVGCFVPLAFIPFFLGRTSTPQEDKEQGNEEEEKVFVSLEHAELSPPLDESESLADLDSAELASSSGLQYQSEQASQGSE